MKAYICSFGGENMEAVILASSEQDAWKKLRKYIKKEENPEPEDIFEVEIIK